MLKRKSVIPVLLLSMLALSACPGGGGGGGASTTSGPSVTTLSTSPGRLNPLFDSNTRTYAIGVAIHGVTSIDITPTFDSGLTATVNGQAATSGAATTVNLAYSQQDFSIPLVLTDTNGTTGTYTLNITRRALSNVIALANITFSAGTLTPAFDSATTTYTLTIPASAQSIKVTPTTSEVVQIARVAGVDVKTGTESAPQGIAVTGSTITVSSSAEDGTGRNYTINVEYEACPAGYYDIAGTCTQVGIGFYSTGSNDRTACTNKPLNAAYSSAVATSATCPWTCDNGYLSNGTACIANADAEVLACANGEVAVGLVGRAGLIIDRVGLRCATISGTSITGAASDGAFYGGNGGNPFNTDGSLDCPADHALFEIDGNLTSFLSVNRTGKLRYRCKHLTTGTLSAWLPSDSTYWGASETRPAFNHKCGQAPNELGSYVNGLVIDNASNASYVGDILSISCR